MKCNSIQFYPSLSDQMTNDIEFIAFIVCQPVPLYQLTFQCVTVCVPFSCQILKYIQGGVGIDMIVIVRTFS